MVRRRLSMLKPHIGKADYIGKILVISSGNRKINGNQGCVFMKEALYIGLLLKIRESSSAGSSCSWPQTHLRIIKRQADAAQPSDIDWQTSHYSQYYQNPPEALRTSQERLQRPQTKCKPTVKKCVQNMYTILRQDYILS